MEPSIAHSRREQLADGLNRCILQPAYEQFHIGPKQSERIDLALTAPPEERV